MAWQGRAVRFSTAQRAQILARDPMCVHCGDRPSTIADHRMPVAEGGANTIANGQGMCVPCHDVKTAAETRRGSARWSARRPRQNRPPEQHPGVIR